MPGLDVEARVMPQWRDAAGRWARADAGDALAAAVQQWGTTAVRELRDATPVRTGQARAAWRADYLPSVRTVKVSNQKPYVPYLFSGTRPHEIRARTARALRFEVGGRAVYAPLVHHPGTRPTAALVAALERIARSVVAAGGAAYVALSKQLGS
jgi:uncharacterized protein YcaQ